LHALLGIKTVKHTFILIVKVGHTCATKLVDTGSTITFMSPSFAAQVNCPLTPARKMEVTVANGEIYRHLSLVTIVTILCKMCTHFWF
jgi:predicted aspartyl protease